MMNYIYLFIYFCVLYELFTLRNYYDDDRRKKVEKIN